MCRAERIWLAASDGRFYSRKVIQYTLNDGRYCSSLHRMIFDSANGDSQLVIDVASNTCHTLPVFLLAVGIAIPRLVTIGPHRHCSPRHLMPVTSSKRVRGFKTRRMTWR